LRPEKKGLFGVHPERRVEPKISEKGRGRWRSIDNASRESICVGKNQTIRSTGRHVCPYVWGTDLGHLHIKKEKKAIVSGGGSKRDKQLTER